MFSATRPKARDLAPPALSLSFATAKIISACEGHAASYARRGAGVKRVLQLIILSVTDFCLLGVFRWIDTKGGRGFGTQEWDQIASVQGMAINPEILHLASITAATATGMEIC